MNTTNNMCNKLGEFQKHNNKRKLDMKEHILHDSIYIKVKSRQNSSTLLKARIERLHANDSNYMTSWKMQNYGDSNKIIGCQVLGSKG